MTTFYHDMATLLLEGHTMAKSTASSLKPISIPYSLRRNANERRYGQARTDVAQCLLCSKPLSSEGLHLVMLDDGCGQIIDPSSEEGQGEQNGGCFFIGPDCWRRNRQLHPYEVTP